MKRNKQSRSARRACTKSATRLDCQHKTNGAANRARKSMQGQPRMIPLMREWQLAVQKDITLEQAKEFRNAVNERFSQVQRVLASRFQWATDVKPLPPVDSVDSESSQL